MEEFYYLVFCLLIGASHLYRESRSKKKAGGNVEQLLRQADEFFNNGQVDAGVIAAEMALKIARKEFAPNSLQVAECLARIARDNKALEQVLAADKMKVEQSRPKGPGRLIKALLARYLSGRKVPEIPPRFHGKSAPMVGVHMQKRPLANGTEFLLNVEGNTAFVQYKPPQSYAFELPGVWAFGNQEGELQAEDGSGIVAVALVSAVQLRLSPEETLLRKAAGRCTRSYADALEREVYAEVTAFPCERFRAVKWTGKFLTDPSNAQSACTAAKILFELSSEWVGELTIAGLRDEGATIRHVLNSFGMTPDPKGYMPMLQDHYGMPIEELERV